jgi:carboxylate-amine ligase
LDGRLIDLDCGETYPAAEAVERLLSWTAPMREERGLEVELPALNGAPRQLRMCESGMSLGEMYAATVAETRETYAPGIVEVTRCGR